MSAKLLQVTRKIEIGLSAISSNVEQLCPEESALVRDRWWRTFLPGLVPETKVRNAVMFLRTQVPRALKAESSYLNQSGGAFFLLTEHRAHALGALPFLLLLLCPLLHFMHGGHGRHDASAHSQHGRSDIPGGTEGRWHDE